MALFDFINDLPGYDQDNDAAGRLNKRHQFLVEPFKGDLQDARVLDLAAHDGRWSYALGDADPKFVHAVEARGDVAERFKTFPDTPAKAKVRMEVGDIFTVLERFIEKRRSFDVIAVFGVFYHITEHYRLLTLIKQLRPKLVLVDSEFTLAKAPSIMFAKEAPDNPLNSVERIPGQDMTMIGTPSRRWLEVACDTLGYDLEWQNWNDLPSSDRNNVQDYFRKAGKCRATVALRPIKAD